MWNNWPKRENRLMPWKRRHSPFLFLLLLLSEKVRESVLSCMVSTGFHVQVTRFTFRFGNSSDFEINIVSSQSTKSQAWSLLNFWESQPRQPRQFLKFFWIWALFRINKFLKYKNSNGIFKSWHTLIHSNMQYLLRAILRDKFQFYQKILLK